jgi:UDP-N-acetyl-D-galactosamine dehydrogenase
MRLQDIRLAVIGLGYVGLPLAAAFGRKRPVVGFDISQRRVEQLCAGLDTTRETTPEELAAARYLTCTTRP